MDAAMLARLLGELPGKAPEVSLMELLSDLILGHHRVDLPHGVGASEGAPRAGRLFRGPGWCNW